MRSLCTRRIQMRVLSTSTMAEDGFKHKNNANESAKNKNNGRRLC